MNKKELKHFGVPGMKWGEHKYNPYIVGVGKSSGSTTSQKRTTSIKPLEIQRLSNVGQNKIDTSGLSAQRMDDILKRIMNIYVTKTSEEAKRLEDLGKRHMSFLSLSHSAKGSTWEEHKYIKRIDGVYYYPDSYEGGRHLSDEQKKNEAVDIEELTEDDIEKLADEVIRGNFGNGQERKEALGAHYQTVQDRVNQKLKSGGGSGSSSKSPSKSDSNTDSKKETTKTTTSAKKAKGIDLDKVYGVYDRQAERDKDKKKKKTTSTKKRDTSSRTPTRISEKKR